jgi:Flp pilus assembly protein TadD
MSPQSIRDKFSTAQRLHKSGQRASALALYQAILGDHPDHAPTLHMLGVLALQDGKRDEAAARIRRAIEIEPRAEFYSNLGLVLGAQGKTDEAVAADRESIRLNPKSPEAHNNMGILLVKQGRMDLAIAALQTACQLKPDHADALRNLARACRKAGRKARRPEGVGRKRGRSTSPRAAPIPAFPRNTSGGGKSLARIDLCLPGKSGTLTGRNRPKTLFNAALTCYAYA